MKRNKLVIGFICLASFVLIVIIMLVQANKVVGFDDDTQNMSENQNDIFTLFTEGKCEEIKELIASGVSINTVNERNGSNLLHYALNMGETEFAVWLIDNGIEYDKVNSMGNSPIMLAVFNDNTIVFEKLKDKSNLGLKNNVGENMLHAAAASGNVGYFDFLIKSGLSWNDGNAKGLLPIVYADTVEVLKYIISSMEISELSEDLKNDLWFNARTIEISQYLLENGYSINSVDANGDSALLSSMIYKRNDIFEFLLENSINPNIQDNDGNTVLHIACSNGYYDNVKMLLIKNADISILNKNGQTPYDLAKMSENNRIIELFGVN